MTQLPDYKRGDDFQLGMKYQDGDGIGIDITSIEIKCQLRTSSGNLVSDLSVSKLNQSGFPGEFVLFVSDPKTTKSWPTRIVFGDVKLTINDRSVSSEVFEFSVVKGVTE